MCLWVHLKDVPSAAFLIPNKDPMEPQLFSFHFSLPMGYAESVPDFCMATKTVAEMSNASLGYRHRSKAHPLESNVATRAADDSGEPT